MNSRMLRYIHKIYLSIYIHTYTRNYIHTLTPTEPHRKYVHKKISAHINVNTYTHVPIHIHILIIIIVVRRSLAMAIVNMAQTFVGSNNINVLVGSGQFGTRLQGGADAASPRYIFTFLNRFIYKYVYYNVYVNVHICLYICIYIYVCMRVFENICFL